MPLASMSKVTSIWGTPRGAGGIPTRVNWPSTLLSAAISLSPWHTLISTWVCPSAAVEKTWGSGGGDRGSFNTVALTSRQDCSVQSTYLALLGGNCGVPVDELGEDPTQSLNTQWQRRHIQQQHVSDVTGQDATLDGCSYGNSFIRVDRLAGSTTKQVLDCLLNLQTHNTVFSCVLVGPQKYIHVAETTKYWTQLNTSVLMMRDSTKMYAPHVIPLLSSRCQFDWTSQKEVSSGEINNIKSLINVCTHVVIAWCLLVSWHLYCIQIKDHDGNRPWNLLSHSWHFVAVCDLTLNKLNRNLLSWDLC